MQLDESRSADLRFRNGEPFRGRDSRTALGRSLAQQHDGVVRRRTLHDHGVDRHGVRIEVLAGRWRLAGRHTIVVDGREVLDGEARWWWAVWESGSGARLDGVSALLAQGLQAFAEPTIHVTVPRESTAYRMLGVTVHRRRQPDPMTRAGVPRSRPEWATVRAAQWARSDRQAALLLCLPLQQRLVSPGRLLQAWRDAGRGPRARVIDAVVRDLCAGAQSLGELDFAMWCRRYRLPEPTRQSVRTRPGGRVYLDVEWDEQGVVAEIDGAHHLLGIEPVKDALRANDVVLEGGRLLRLPVLGLRLEPDAFMGQIARALGATPVLPRRKGRWA